MPRITRITELLHKELAPLVLNIRDDSHQHAGHAGAHADGQTHLHIHIISEKFAGLSRVQQHQLVYKLLDGELKGTLHAVSLDTQVP